MAGGKSPCAHARLQALVGVGLVFALVVFFTGDALAHGGGVSADGCHRDKSTGERHRHKGESGAPCEESSAQTSASSVRAGAVLEGMVTRVKDGDTFVLLGHSVRLAGFDAPESAQAFGAESRAALSGLVSGVEVRCEITSVGRYGRPIGLCTAAGVSIGVSMVSGGYAWDASYAPSYASEQAAAKSAKRGLWALPSPCKPRLFRRKQCS